MCSPRLPEAHFWKPTLNSQPSKINLLDLRMPEMKDEWAIFFAFIALLPVRFAFFRLQSPIRFLIFAAKNVYFCFRSPISKTTTSITLANLWFFQILGLLWKLCLASLLFSHAFSSRFSYFRPWFCHCSWEALLTVTSIPACTLVPISIFPL